MSQYGLEHHGIVSPGKVHWNLPVTRLVEEAVKRDEGVLTNSGALNAMTGKRTGRSPRDKFVVDEPSTHDKIWWGKVNQPMTEKDYLGLRHEVLAYLQGRELFVMDGFAGADSALLDADPHRDGVCLAQSVCETAFPPGHAGATQVARAGMDGHQRLPVSRRPKEAQAQQRSIRHRGFLAQDRADRWHAVRRRDEEEHLLGAQFRAAGERRFADALFGQRWQMRAMWRCFSD